MKSKMCGVHMVGSVFTALLGQHWVNMSSYLLGTHRYMSHKIIPDLT